MECDILDSLNDLGYSKEFCEDESIKKVLLDEPCSVPFTEVVSWLSLELETIAELEEHVNAITNKDDFSSFLLEVSALLRELDCPYQTLISGPVEERLNNRESRLKLLDYLTSELSSSRIIYINKPTPLIVGEKKRKQDDETEVAFLLKTALTTLDLSNTPVDVKPEKLFADIESTLKNIIENYPNSVEKCALTHSLTAEQWAKLDEIITSLNCEYEVRREMLLKRIDVTVQSFMWSKSLTNEILKVYTPKRGKLQSKCPMSIPMLLSSRQSLLNHQKTSSGKEREVTKCEINKVLIGSVPDRGGRAWEYDIPREMPSFKKRAEGGGGRGGRRGGFGKDKKFRKY
ncbi:protein FAM98A [Octopus sinensis]|uniref:Protein FAM98A n=1 Tax=Octopus sinensis TaxID=2607531 RepID=A0A6P7SRH2_9MOLL|nr:protein FAM98A [Octopus sinensis]